MDRDRLHELAAFGAIGALTPEEEKELNALIAQGDPLALAESGAWRDVAALIAVAQPAPVAPSPSVKEKLLARIGEESPPATAVEKFYNIRDEADSWRPFPVEGVRVKDLTIQKPGGYSVKIYELAPGTRFPGHPHSGAEECYVLSGDFHVEGHPLVRGDFHHAPAGTVHGESYTETGCRLLIIAPAEDYSQKG